MEKDTVKSGSEERGARRGSVRPVIIGSAIAAVLGTVGAVIYYIAYITSYEADIMHYRAGSREIIAAGCLICGAVVAALAAAIASRKTAAREQLPVKGDGGLFFSLFTALMFAAYVVSTIVSNKGLPTGALEIATLAAAVVAAAAMILRTSRVGTGASGVILSLFPMAHSALLIFVYYFDLSSAPINSPEKGLTNVLLSISLLLFMSDSRDRLGRISPVLAVFTRITAAFVLGPAAAARIALRFTAGLSHPPFIVNVLLFSVALYGAYLLALTVKKMREPLPPEPAGTEEEDKEAAGSAAGPDKED